MADDKDVVVVERGGGGSGAVIAVVLLLIVLAVLAYLYFGTSLFHGGSTTNINLNLHTT